MSLSEVLSQVDTTRAHRVAENATRTLGLVGVQPDLLLRYCTPEQLERTDDTSGVLLHHERQPYTPAQHNVIVTTALDTRLP